MKYNDAFLGVVILICCAIVIGLILLLDSAKPLTQRNPSNPSASVSYEAYRAAQPLTALLQQGGRA